MIMLSMGLWLPYLFENLKYASTRGALRAKSDAAKLELDELAGKAELVSLTDTSRAFRAVAQRIAPSVVHIDTLQFSAGPKRIVYDDWGVPRSDQEVYRSQEQGSGVIVDSQGYVLTNHHVVRQARQISVTLSDGRTIPPSKVKVVGADVLTDLAVLKLDADGLVAAEWGDSEALEVGDWVLAIGNPYGLDRTVTSGIVSATHRRNMADFSPHQNFIQTDAAVNPGNSGGPLVNIQGKLVGITTAIVGTSFQGISFAIPSSVAKEVYEQLLESGSVSRGYIGVVLAEITEEYARQLNLNTSSGAVVLGVEPESAADQAQIRAGDVVVEWNGQPVEEKADLILMIAATPVGQETPLVIIRGGERMPLKVKVAERPETIAVPK